MAAAKGVPTISGESCRTILPIGQCWPTCVEVRCSWRVEGVRNGSEHFQKHGVRFDHSLRLVTQISKVDQAAPENILNKPLPRESMRTLFPTVPDGVAFEMTDHEAIHLGQLSAWRRAMGMGRA